MILNYGSQYLIYFSSTLFRIFRNRNYMFVYLNLNKIRSLGPLFSFTSSQQKKFTSGVRQRIMTPLHFKNR